MTDHTVVWLRWATVIVGLIFLWLVLKPVRAADRIPQRADQYAGELRQEALRYWGLGAPVPVFAAQIHQESAWRPDARSPYANGLAQFTPGTASDMARWYRSELGGLAGAFDASWAIRALILYDRRLYGYIGTKTDDSPNCDRWAMTLSAYNGGGGWTARDIRLCRNVAGCDPARWWGHVERYSSRASWAKKENRDYPDKILHRWQPLYAASIKWAGKTVCEVMQ